MQSIDQFRANLADPDYAVGFILRNNAAAVADNLRGMGLVVSTPDDITNALNQFLERGQDELFVQALTVPVDMDNITQEELVVLAQVANAQANAAGRPLAKSAEGGFNINALLGALATGALFYLNSTGKPAVNPTTTPPAATPKDNTMTYVLIGGAVVLVVILIVVLTRKK